MIADMIAEHRALKATLEQGELGPEEEEALSRLEVRLHGALTGAMRNPLIERKAQRLQNYQTLVWLEHLVAKPLALRTLREHLDILTACAERDPDAAEAALATHFQLAFQRFVGMA